MFGLVKSIKQLKMERLTGKKSPQHVFNSVLWEMIMQHGGQIRVSGDHLRNLPDKLMVKGDWDEATQSMIITAVQNKSGFVTCGKLDLIRGVDSGG